MNEIAKNYPELVLGFIIASAILGAIRFIFAQHLENKKVSFQKIELIDNVLKFNLNKPNARQKFITEQAFLAVFGKAFIFNEIKTLLSYDSPSEAISLYLKGRRFLKVSRAGKSFVLNEDYRRFKILKVYYYFQDFKFFMLYFLFSFLMIFPMTIINSIYSDSRWLEDSFGLINIFWIFVAGVLTIMLAGFALFSMMQLGKITQAFKLVAKKSSK